MYEQIVLPNYNIPYTGGLCEKFVENTVGLTGIYYSATAAWQANQGNHAEAPPAGLRVPVFFSLGSTGYGHVAVQLEDGRVASSTQSGTHSTAYIHPSLQNLVDVYAKANNGCTYLGWSEYIGKKQIVKQGDDEMITDINQLNALWRGFRGRNAHDDEVEAYLGKIDYAPMVASLDQGEEREAIWNTLQVGKTAVIDNWQGQITTLSTSNAELAKEVTDLKSELAVQSDDTTNLNALGVSLQWIIKRLGLKG